MTTTAVHPALEARDAAVAAFEAADTALAAAQAAERSAPKPSAARAVAKKARLSQGAKKANRVKEIRQAELDLRIDGVEFTPWVQPAPRIHGAKGTYKSQAELQATLNKVRAYAKGLKKGQDDALIHDVEVRVASIKRAADAAGYKLS